MRLHIKDKFEVRLFVNDREIIIVQTLLFIIFIKEMESQQYQKLKKFLKQNQPSLTKETKNVPLEDIKASILDTEELQEASQSLKDGRLVAFPTQTVYGLGADARNEQALKMIYSTKKRPLTDPIIVHVLDAKQAQKLVLLGEKQKNLFDLLTKKFWPGPLTIILKANLEQLPLIVTAQTGFVGVRAPKHPYARKLLEVSGLPIGAPSANLFSHVSPTQPIHVFNDFYNCEVSIVDGGRCEFGVESTVLKLLDDQIQIFREGSLSVSKLQSYLKSVLSAHQLPPINVLRKVVSKNTNMQAPGQLLKHYAPYLPCYIYSGESKVKQFENKTNKHKFKLQNSAFISFGKQQYSQIKQKSKNYFQVGSCLTEVQQELQSQLFCSKQQKLQMRQIYYLLRLCQNLAVEAIVIGWRGQREGTAWDKIYRSTQGQQVLQLE